MSQLDLDGDGKVEREERTIFERKNKTQQRLALAAMFALIVSGLWLVFFASPEKINSVGTVLDFYWITLGGVIATYMGSEAWISRK